MGSFEHRLNQGSSEVQADIVPGLNAKMAHVNDSFPHSLLVGDSGLQKDDGDSATGKDYMGVFVNKDMHKAYSERKDGCI